MGKSGREKGDGKKSEGGGISNMGREKLAGKGKFSWRDMFFGGKREWWLPNIPIVVIFHMFIIYQYAYIIKRYSSFIFAVCLGYQSICVMIDK